MTEFEGAYGFSRQDVTLGNWREAPYSRWSFHNLRELVPTSHISCGAPGSEAPFTGNDLLSQKIAQGAGGASTVAQHLEHSHTDAFVLMRRGEIFGEYYAAHSGIKKPHVIFSVSKSITAMVSGILEAEGVLDPEKPVSAYLPEAVGSAYGGCRYRDVLDMRVSLDFNEVYLDKNGAFARYRRAMLWNPPEPGTSAEDLRSLLLSLKKADRPHGGPFFYASPNSDLLGIILERVSGKRYAELVSELLWQPIEACSDAYVTVDAVGTARAAGGVCVTARDLARVGELVRTGGACSGRQVLPGAWVSDMLTNGDPDAWRAGGENVFPDGRYRSQWYQTGEASGAFCAIGIHGQWIYVDPSREVTISKLSSQPNPVDDELKFANLAFFRAVCSAFD